VTSVAGRIAALASSLPSVVPSDVSGEEHWLGLAEQIEREGRLLLANGVDGVLPLAHAVIFATSATTALVKHYHLRRNAVVCDVSRPRNIDREVIGAQRADLLLMEGGLIEIPGHPDLGGCGAAEHLAYACMAETMLLALEQRYAHMSLGASIDVAGALRMRALADQHGFEVMVPSTLALLPAARARAKLEACS
jgi:predicted amino acid dehydrogenase